MYEELLKVARETLESQVSGKEARVSEDIKKRYGKKQACFVTLTENGDLRGCIGSLEARQELWRDVIENTINAGFNDSRFPALTEEELVKIKIEISVLSKPEKLGRGREVYDKIDNKMGIILKHDEGSATFLPQVWEQVPDKDVFLEQLSLKAGLFQDDWKESEIWFYRVEKVEE